MCDLSFFNLLIQPQTRCQKDCERQNSEEAILELLIAGVSSWGREKDFLLVFINDKFCIREAAKKHSFF